MTSTNPTEAQMKLARECAIEHRAAAWTDQRYDDSVNAAYRNGALDDDMRVQVTLLAIKATEARAQGLVEALENLLDDGHSFESEGQARDAARRALATWRRT